MSPPVAHAIETRAGAGKEVATFCNKAKTVKYLLRPVSNRKDPASLHAEEDRGGKAELFIQREVHPPVPRRYLI